MIEEWGMVTHHSYSAGSYIKFGVNVKRKWHQKPLKCKAFQGFWVLLVDTVQTHTVGERGLEPPRITPLVPKTSAATDYATRPHYAFDCFGVSTNPTPCANLFREAIASRLEIGSSLVQ